MKTYKHETWKDENKNDLAYLWYGNIREDKQGDLIFVPYTTYSDYSGSTVERSNCEAFLRLFDPETDQYSCKVWEVIGGHGTCGVVILKSLLDEDEEIQELFENLENYPLIDEDDLSQLEMELEDESWDIWVKFDLEYELEKNNIEFDEDTIQNHFWRVIIENNIYFIHEDAVCPYIDIDEVVKNWSNIKDEN